MRRLHLLRKESVNYRTSAGRPISAHSFPPFSGTDRAAKFRDADLPGADRQLGQSDLSGSALLLQPRGPVEHDCDRRGRRVAGLRVD